MTYRDNDQFRGNQMGWGNHGQPESNRFGGQDFRGQERFNEPSGGWYGQGEHWPSHRGDWGQGRMEGRRFGGEDQYGHLVTTSAELTQHLEAVDAREHDVEHDEIDAAAIETIERCLAVAHQLDLVTVQREVVAHHLAQRAFVFDDQDRTAHDAISLRGSQNTKVAPCPVPALWASTASLQKYIRTRPKQNRMRRTSSI